MNFRDLVVIYGQIPYKCKSKYYKNPITSRMLLQNYTRHLLYKNQTTPDWETFAEIVEYLAMNGIVR